ncbi:MAG: thioredoxin family protein [Alphaproteobacteria bacterium]|nr:thioredoxin family protein [Alphaproteobacteria bacterium]
MKQFWVITLILWCCMFTAVSCFAQNNTQSTANTTVELFHNGKDEVLAKFTLKPDWHIYWSNPGEIGLPTVVEAQNSDIDIINQSVPQIRNIYEVMSEYVYENTAYFELKLDNLQQAEISFDFVECNDICKPEKLIFNMAELPASDDKLWREIKNIATATFPQKIELIGSSKQNEIQLDTAADDVKFIPTSQDVINNETVEISQNKKNVKVKWEPLEEKQLKQALIVADGRAYLADIKYRQDYFALIYMVLLAFIGGMILNAMPCVFPILSLKIFTLLKQRRRSKIRAKINALLYTLGVLASFLLLTSCLIGLKNSGEAVGWGFQLQSNWFVGTMAVLFLLLFLYMTEWLRFPDFANRFIHKAAALNDFTTGFFAVLIASPCTGPFMGAAIGYAFMRSSIEVFFVFTSLALGYALPYALIEMYPQALSRILPKPGKWMRNVKIVLSIPVLLTSVWLGSVWYSQFTDSYAVDEENVGGLKWLPFEAETIAELNENRENIFIDFTADWCLTCKFNEKILINTARFKNFVKQNNVHLFVADLTENNELYHQALSEYGRDGIPVYIYYRGGKYKILPLFFRISDMEE